MRATNPEISGIELRNLRWAGGAVLAAGVAMSRLPASAGVPCPLRTLTGVPCPLCGMTTSVKASTSLQFADALAANPAGLLTVAVALALLVLRPSRLPLPPASVAVPALALVWLFQLDRFGFV